MTQQVPKYYISSSSYNEKFITNLMEGSEISGSLGRHPGRGTATLASTPARKLRPATPESAGLCSHVETTRLYSETKRRLVSPNGVRFISREEKSQHHDDNRAELQDGVVRFKLLLWLWLQLYTECTRKMSSCDRRL